MENKQSRTKLFKNRIAIITFSGILPILMLLAFISLAKNYSPAQAQTPGQEKIGNGVVEVLQSDKHVRVVIALKEPFTQNTGPVNLSQVRQEVSRSQDAVLYTLSNADFSTTHKFQAVPALAGNILTEAGLYKIASNPAVVKIDLDVGGTGSLAVSVPLIEADTWHAVGNIGDGVVVAVLDSGLDTDHSDLASSLIHQECFIDNDGSINGSGLCPNGSDRQSGSGAAEDDAGHGTHVTGIIASRGNQSSVGVAPGVSVISVKVTAGPSFAGVFYFFSEIVAALDYIIINRPDVQIINMSLGTNAQFAGDCDNSTSWNIAGAAAINTLRAQGVVSFASAGNTGSGTVMGSPACLSNVISVGATDNSDTIAAFSDSNSSTDILAPGVGIVSSAIGNSTTTASGTSMASPHAAGCAALLIASQEAVTPDQIETRLETSPVQVFNAKNGLTFPRIECALKPLTNLNISGPSSGFTGQEIPFVATVNPITATQPITYFWQAAGQSPITNTNGLSDNASFTWQNPGTQVISVTAHNLAGPVMDIYTITVNVNPLISVDISGPTTGFMGQELSFIAAVNPITATQPITYLWQAAGQLPITNTNGLSDSASFTWQNPGTQVITVTAQNLAGFVMDVYTITLSANPLMAADISGPMTGFTGQEISFTAAVSPITATQPITYFWQASAQPTVTNTSALSDTTSFTWNTAGTKMVAISAENSGSVVTNTYTIRINTRIYLPIVLK